MPGGSQQSALVFECVCDGSQKYCAQRGGTFSSQKQPLTAEGKVRALAAALQYVLSAQLAQAGTPRSRQREYSHQCVHPWIALTDLHPGVIAWSQLGTAQGRPAQH